MIVLKLNEYVHTTCQKHYWYQPCKWIIHEEIGFYYTNSFENKQECLRLRIYLCVCTISCTFCFEISVWNDYRDNKENNCKYNSYYSVENMQTCPTLNLIKMSKL